MPRAAANSRYSFTRLCCSDMGLDPHSMPLMIRVI